eukprot:1176727-Prorocentrum_minimum.AAC.7
MPLTSTLRKCPWRPPQLHRWCAAAKEALSPPAWVTPEAAPEGEYFARMHEVYKHLLAFRDEQYFAPRTREVHKRLLAFRDHVAARRRRCVMSVTDLSRPRSRGGTERDDFVTRPRRVRRAGGAGGAGVLDI